MTGDRRVRGARGSKKAADGAVGMGHRAGARPVTQLGAGDRVEARAGDRSHAGDRGQAGESGEGRGW